MRIENSTITELMGQINTEGSRGWNGAAGRELIGLLGESLSPLARRHGRPVDDAVSAAWMELTNEALLSEPSIIGVLLHRVGLRLMSESKAERLLIGETNTEKLTAAAGVEVNGLPERFDERAVQESTDEADAVAFRLVSSRLAAALLVESGLAPSAAEAVVDTLLDVAASGGEGSSVNALRRAASSSALGEHLGVSPSSWSAIASMLLGSKRGTPGLIQSELDGQDSPLIVARARKSLGLAA